MNTAEPSPFIKFIKQTRPKTAAETILAAWLLAIIGVMVFFILHNVAWLYGDDWFFMSTIGQGQPLKMDFFFYLRRFYPLAFQEYNAFIFINQRLPAMYLWLAFKFIIFAVFLYLALARALSRAWSLFAVGLFGVLNGRVLTEIFTDIIYPENSLLPLLAIFIYCYLKASLNNRWRYYFPAALAAFLASYFKEPFFGLFMAAATVNLVFRYRGLKPGEKWFSYFMLANGAVYLGLYYLLVLKDNAGASYLGLWNQAARPEIMWAIIRESAGLVVIGPLARLGHWLVHLKRPAVPFEFTPADALAAGGLAYGTAFVILGLNAFYYFTISSLLSFTACGLYAAQYGRPLAEGWKHANRAGRLARTITAGSTKWRILGAAVMTAWLCGGLIWFVKAALGCPNILNRKLSLAAAPFWPEFFKLDYELYFWTPPAPPRETEQYAYQFAPWPAYYQHHALKTYRGEAPPPDRVSQISSFDEFQKTLRGALLNMNSNNTPWRDNPDYLTFLAYPNYVVIRRREADIIQPLILKYLTKPDGLEAVKAIKADLDALKKALEAYHNQYGGYPKSRGLAALYRLDGTKDKNWIPGLAPIFIDELPRDRKLSRNPYEQYMYMSDGLNYKLWAHNKAPYKNEVFMYPEMIDPIRPCCLAHWTPAAEAW